jgi:hypothetical protein
MQNMAIPNEAPMKQCSKCGMEKPISEFYTRTPREPRRSPYLHAECKACIRARTARWHAAHLSPADRLKSNTDQRRRRMQKKEIAFAAYGGYRCACCGETEASFLSIDHIHNDGAEFRRTHFKSRVRGLGAHLYAWLIRRHFPSGYQVLCMNCQTGKRMNGGICPHQGTRNDQAKAVGSSEPKRNLSDLKLVG